MLGAFAAVPPLGPCAAQSAIQLDTETRLILSDNPFLIAGEDRAAAAVELSARPDVLWSLAPDTSVQASGNLAYRQYLRRYGGFLNGRAGLLASHRDSEFFSFDGRVGYARELPADALTESMDFSIDTSSPRETFSARTSLSWNPNARTSVAGAAGWEKLRYPDSPLLSPTRAFSGELGVSRRFSERTTLGVLASATLTKGEWDGSSSAKSLLATVTHRPGPHWQADAQLGVEWAEAGIAVNSDRPYLSGSGSLCYRPAPLDACLSASLQSEVSGFGGLRREFFVGATLGYHVSDRGTVAAIAEYRTAEPGGVGSRMDALRISSSYEHRMTSRLLVTGGVGYLRRTFLTSERNGAMVLQIGITLRGKRR